jgi:hypothetical protein
VILAEACAALTFGLMNDTSPAADALQMELYARMPARKRVRQAITRSASLRRMVWQRVVEAHPAASADQLRLAFASRWLGEELADRVYGGAQHG